MIVAADELTRLEKQVTMVDGGFDPLHPGHLAYFRAAADLGRPLLCNVRDDSYLTSAKGRPPLLDHSARAQLLDSLQPISYVHPCTTSTFDVLERLRPAAYAKGADWRGRLPKAETDLCARAGIEVVFLETVHGSSTTLVRDFLDKARTKAVEDRHAAVPELTARQRLPVRQPYGCIGSTHMNRYLSGVARFNHLLAGRLGVRCLSFTEAVALGPSPLFLSVKFSDCSKAELRAFEAAFARLASRRVAYSVFFHSFSSLPVEFRLAAGAAAVFAGNTEIAAMLVGGDVHPRALWCPSLLDGDVLPETSGLTLFSFGMSHKMQPEHYRRLHDVLEDAHIRHTLLVSTAFHEKASFGDLDEIEMGFREVFGSDVHLLGFLSDAAVGHFLARADLFCAFFPSGVRANNTSVAAAMSRATPVLTNLDRYSPGWMRHGTNVLDVRRTAASDLRNDRLAAIAEQAVRDVEMHAGWATLTEAVTQSVADKGLRALLDPGAGMLSPARAASDGPAGP